MAPGLLEPAALGRALRFQPRQAGVPRGPARLTLGEILVATGQISRELLEEALSHHRRSGRKLGEELLTTGYLGQKQLAHALSLQQRLGSGVLAALLSIAALGAQETLAGETRVAFGSVQVTATVLAVARVRPLRQASSLRITAVDVARGYVDVPAGSVFEVSSNSVKGVVFTIYNEAEFVRSIVIRGLGAHALLGPSGGEVVYRGAGRDVLPRSVTLGYRFELLMDTRPGTYPWPLLISVGAL